VVIKTDKVLLEDQAAAADRVALVQQAKETLAALTTAEVVALVPLVTMALVVVDSPVAQVALDLRLLFLVQP
jgi:hypothetical protein